MDMTILIAAAIATTLPCVALWLADQHDRMRTDLVRFTAEY